MKKKTKQKPIAIQNRINDLYQEGKGYRVIAAQLKEEGYDTSFMTVKRYLEKIKNEKQAVLTTDTGMQNYVRERIFDTGENLKKVNAVLWELMDSAKKHNIDKKFTLSVIKQILQTTRLADDLMNEFKGLNIKQTGDNSQIQLIQVVVSKLQEFEDRGDIKILNPRLKGEKKNGESRPNKETKD